MAHDRANQYRQKADECREHAVSTRNEQEKAAWLRLAEDWQRLAQSVDRVRPPQKPPSSR